MKKAFTLVEMLIVVVVLVTLMTITFRLSSIGSDQSKRNATIARMQRIENCLSGYYAAFGSYPQVRLHGSRNIYAKADGHGIQSDSEENRSIWGWTSIGEKPELEAWNQVKAACKSQPVDCRYPFPAESAYNELVKSVSEAIKQKAANADNVSDEQKKVLAAGFDNGVTDNAGRHNGQADQSDWRQIQLFKFGLMSYLLPRYLVMMNSKEELYREGNYGQWTGNNRLPVNPLKGQSSKWNWQTIRTYSRSDNPEKFAEVANIPSQAVTARWMPNLAGIVCCNHDYKLYGIDIRGDSGASDLRADNLDIQVYSPGGNGSTGQQYVLDGVTVLDGWWHEFYYYSPAPYQTYTLWSAGPNNRTFPPWISRKALDSKANRCVGLWVEDDIVRMSN